MKLWTILWIAVFAPVCAAQRLTVPEFARIARVCGPEANLPDLVAIARTESNFNPWALSVNRPTALAHRFGYSSGRIYLRHQPRTKQEAVRWTQELEALGITVSVGLLQVNAEHAGYSTAELFEPCTNMEQGWGIFSAAYSREARVFGPGQRALLAALASYNAGAPITGFRNGYVFSVLQHSQ